MDERASQSVEPPPVADAGAGGVPADVPGVASSGRITGALPCARCGYMLSGLGSDGACPECALPVAHSVAGDVLGAAPVSSLRLLQRGAGLIALAVVLSPLSLLLEGGVEALRQSLGSGVLAWVQLLAQVVIVCVVWAPWLVGHWLLTAPSPLPGGAVRAKGVALVVRVGAACYTAALVAGVMVEFATEVSGLGAAGGVTLTSGQQAAEAALMVLSGMVGLAGDRKSVV